MKNHETAAIEQDFPNWSIWKSQHGVCWAATLRVLATGCDPTVIEDSADELRAALAEQSRRMADEKGETDRPDVFSSYGHAPHACGSLPAPAQS